MICFKILANQTKIFKTFLYLRQIDRKTVSHILNLTREEGAAIKIDMRFIAMKAGVSIATVSRVLNHSKKVSAELRERVLTEVDRYQYRPNPQARGLVLDRSSLIGVIMPNVSNVVQALLLEGIEKYVSEFDYQVMISNIGTSFTRQKKGFQIMREWSIDGIILLHENTPTELEQLLTISEDVPVVLASANVRNCPISSVGIDETRAAYEVTRYLAALGHRKIAGIFNGGYTLGELRYDGYKRVLEESGIGFCPDYIFHVDDCTPESGAFAASQLVKLDPMPTAVFCVNDEIAVGAVQQLLRCGHSVPEDISVVGFDDINIASVLTPRLTTIHQPIREIGTKAAQLLIAQIEGKTSSVQHLTLNHELVIRDSSAPPKASMLFPSE